MIRSHSALALLLIASCGGSTGTSPWRTLAQKDFDVAQERQYEQALTARSAMFGALMSRVSAEMAASGPAGTVQVCSEAAPEIAAAIAEEHGVRIGRTSWKLRNPSNVAPAWAAELLADRPAEERSAAGPEGQLGVTLPIHLNANCLVCHGEAAELAPEVREALAAHYPEDNATGFADGDLRGWFWVEVPAAED
jgi:mono/diheme cytochrome c family protein